MGPRRPGHYFCQFEKRLPQTEIKCTRRIHSIPLQSSIFYRKPLFEQMLTHPVTLFYLIWLKKVPKGT